jgi:hypothetical protein
LKLRAADYAAFVEHPRFGKGPRFTGLDVADAPDGSIYCHWHSPPGVRVPGTAVAADVSRQRPATLHVTHYHDSSRICRKCARPFLFFAEEQQHWYEELGFPLEADCLECSSCRKAAHRLRAARERYDVLLARTPRTDAETLELVDCALLLAEACVFSAKVLPRLRALLKPLLSDEANACRRQAQALASRIAVVAR